MKCRLNNNIIPLCCLSVKNKRGEVTMSIKNTNDPRVKRTRQLIQDAFVALVGEKDLKM